MSSYICIFLAFLTPFTLFFYAFCLHSGVDSLPLVLKLLCATLSSDLSSSSPFSSMDGVDFKLLYHGETYLLFDILKVIGTFCSFSSFWLISRSSINVPIWLFEFIKIEALHNLESFSVLDSVNICDNSRQTAWNLTLSSVSTAVSGMAHC